MQIREAMHDDKPIYSVVQNPFTELGGDNPKAERKRVAKS